MQLSESRRHRFVRWGAVFVLLMVMLPSITYVGHWDPFRVLPTHAHSLHHEPNDNQDHAAHCHAGPSTCTGPQATIGSWWIGDDQNFIAVSEPAPVPDSTATQQEIEAPVYRLVPPPRSV